MNNPNALPTSPFTDDAFDGAACCDYCDATEVRLIDEDGGTFCFECWLAATDGRDRDEADEGPDDSYDIDADADRAAYYDAADRADAAMECL